MEYGSTECSEQHVPTVMLQGYGGFYDFQGTETLSWAILSHVTSSTSGHFFFTVGRIRKSLAPWFRDAY